MNEIMNNTNEKEHNKRIITEEGLFYSNFDRLKLPLSLIEGSASYSENLVRIRDTYGLKVGEQQPDASGMIHENTVGVYIVDYQRYLMDLGVIKDNNNDDIELNNGPRLK